MKITMEFDNENEARIAMRANHLMNALEKASERLNILTVYPKEPHELAEGIAEIREIIRSALADVHRIYLQAW